MKALRLVALIFLVLIATVLAAIYFLPETAHMERSIYVEASSDRIYNELISYRNFNEWSPWAQKDADAAYTFEGPLMGVGAKMHWESDNPDLGNGSMELIEVNENEYVVSSMNFDGYDSSPRATFILNPVQDGTEVTWTYDENEVSGFAKIFMLGIDGFLGSDYELGLNRLKEWVEGAPEFENEIALQNTRSFTFLGMEDSAINDPSIISSKMSQDYGELIRVLSNNGVTSEGYPIAMFSEWDEYDLKFICGIPIADGLELNLVDDMALYSLEGKPCIRATYYGEYNGLAAVRDDIDRYAEYYNYSLTGTPWEEYIIDMEQQESLTVQKTNIYYPIN